MSTEALVTDQTFEGQVEEMKLTDDAKHVDEESCFQSKDPEEKVEEKINVEDSANGAAAATESESAVVSEEKQEVKKSESAADRVKEEEAKDEPVEIDENPEQEAHYSVAVQPTVEAYEKELENQLDVTGTHEEILPVSSEFDTQKKAEEAPVVSTVVEPAPDVITTGDVSESTEISEGETNLAKLEEEPTITDSKELEEVSDKTEETAVPERADAVEIDLLPENAHEVPEALEADQTVVGVEEGSPLVTELEDEEGISTSEETPNVHETTEADQNALESVVETNVPETTEDDQTAFESVENVSIDTNTAIETAPVNELKKDDEVAPAIEDAPPNALETVESNDKALEIAKESGSIDTNPLTESIETVESNEKALEIAKESGSIDTNPLTESTTVGELKGEEAVSVSEETHDVPEADPNALKSVEESVSPDTNQVIESVEGKVEKGMQDHTVTDTEALTDRSVTTEKSEEKTELILESPVDPPNANTAAEVPQVSLEGEKASEGAEVSEDKKVGSDEGEKTTLVETSRDMKVDNLENEKTENEEATITSSQRQSNNIFSKMKHSIVKVKKAIIGKSPSSKTIYAESKDVKA